METQLVRLDAPYNLICGERAEFGLHIATLMVINENEDDKSLEDYADDDNRGVCCYPVVAEKYEPAGRAWMRSSLDDCRVVAEMTAHPTITLRTLSGVLDYLDRSADVSREEAILKCASALKLYGVDVVVPSDAAGVFDVEIEFDVEPGRSVISSAVGSDFFFFATFILDEEAVEADVRGCLESFLRCRQAYLAAFSRWGVKDITFSTRDEEYRSYVDEMNEKAHAAG